MKTFRKLLALILLTISGTACAENISVAPVTLEPGGTVAVPINCEFTNDDITLYQFDLYLPTGVTLAKNSKGRFAAGTTYVLSDRHDEHTASLKENNGFVRFVVSQNDAYTLLPGSGTLLTIYLTADASVSGTLKGYIKNFMMFETDETKHPMSDISFDLIAPAATVKATDIHVNPPTLTLTSETPSKLTATVSPSTATDKSVTWSSDDPNVAVVNQSGYVTAVSNGTTTIKATTNDGTNLSAQCVVTVKLPVLAKSITLNKSQLTFNKEDDTFQLIATVKPDETTEKSVRWVSDNLSVATVNANGWVTAVANGTATITASTIDGSNKTAQCVVIVSIPIDDNTPNVTGKTFTLRCERGYVGYNGATLCSTTQEAASEFAIVDYGTTNYLYDVTNKAFVVHSAAAMAGTEGNRSLESNTEFATAVTGLIWGKTGFETYPWYLEDCFTNWMNMDGELKVCMNTWKEFEGGNGGNTYQVEIVSTSFDATEAIQMLDNYFQTAVEVTDEQYQAALNSVGTDTQYAIYTLKGRTRYYLTSEGYLTAEPSKDCVLTFARTEGDGLFHSPGWKVDACFTNPHLSEEGGASGALLPQGHILTDKQGRDDWEGQVWYLGDNGCYAVRATNAVSDTWGANTYWTVLDNNGDGVPEADYSWAPAFVWLLESDVESVGIRGIDNGPCNESGAWYTLDGRKLNAQPATKGIYIRNNQKVLVK